MYKFNTDGYFALRYDLNGTGPRVIDVFNFNYGDWVTFTCYEGETIVVEKPGIIQGGIDVGAFWTIIAGQSDPGINHVQIQLNFNVNVNANRRGIPPVSYVESQGWYKKYRVTGI
jgi:hypothetical protein